MAKILTGTIFKKRRKQNHAGIIIQMWGANTVLIAFIYTILIFKEDQYKIRYNSNSGWGIRCLLLMTSRCFNISSRMCKYNRKWERLGSIREMGSR